MSEETFSWDEEINLDDFKQGPINVVPAPPAEPENKEEEDKKKKPEDKKDDKSEEAGEAIVIDDLDIEDDDDDDSDNNVKKDKKKKGDGAPQEKSEDDDPTPTFSDNQLVEFANAYDLNPEDLEGSFEEAIDNRVQEMVDNLPQDVQNLVKFTLNGGDYNEFLGKPRVTRKLSDLDLSKEADQIEVVKQTQMAKGDPEEEAQEYAEFLKESGKLASTAKARIKKAIEDEQEADSKEAQQQELRRKEQQKQFRAHKAKLSNSLKSVSSIKFGRGEKTTLVSKLTEPTEEYNGQRVSPFTKQLGEILESGDERSIILAHLVLNDMDLSSVKAAGATEATKKMRDNIQRSKSKSTNRRNPTDFFNKK